MSKTLYVVSSWVPFPESEYGGLHVVIAKDEAEAVSLLLCEDNEYVYSEERRHAVRCAACVADSTKIAVSDSEPSRVVRSFTT